MKRVRPIIPVEYLASALTYDPITGQFTWAKREDRSPQWNGRYAGRPAFISRSHGYLVAVIGVTPITAHRAAWAISHGHWPDGEVDHINGIRDDNRLQNLRCVDRTENARNQKRSAANTSGATGVHRLKSDGRWQSKIHAEGRQIHLGIFSTFEDALAARSLAEAKYGYHENHGRHASGEAA